MSMKSCLQTASSLDAFFLKAIQHVYKYFKRYLSSYLALTAILKPHHARGHAVIRVHRVLGVLEEAIDELALPSLPGVFPETAEADDDEI